MTRFLEKAVTCIIYDISSGLTWNSNIDRITGKANGTIGYIRRNIKTKNRKVRETAYKSLVCPQLEYAAPVWDANNKDKRFQLEKIQRRAACWTVNNFDKRSSVTATLDQLGWRSARPCLLYKIFHGLMAVPLPEYVQPTYRVSRYCHSMTFCQIQTSRNYYKYSFFPLAIVQWNALPENVACLHDLDS